MNDVEVQIGGDASPDANGMRIGLMPSIDRAGCNEPCTRSVLAASRSTSTMVFAPCFDGSSLATRNVYTLAAARVRRINTAMHVDGKPRRLYFDVGSGALERRHEDAAHRRR